MGQTGHGGTQGTVMQIWANGEENPGKTNTDGDSGIIMANKNPN